MTIEAAAMRNTSTDLLGAFTTDRTFFVRPPQRAGWGNIEPGAAVLNAEAPAGFVAVMARGSRSAPVRTAHRPDGSFAVVHGELYWDSAVADNAEQVLDLFAAGGRPALHELEGVANITLWDGRRGELLLTRDPDGSAPCFYVQQGSALYWSTDFRALLPYAGDRSLDLDALDFLLASGFVPSPQTLVCGIRRLPAGKVLVADSPSNARLEHGRRFSGRPKRRLSREERDAGFGEHLERAVRRRYEPGRPAAVLLSSGVDSTLMAGLFARHLGATIPGYTFQYQDYEGWKNEIPLARRAAEHFGIPHHEVLVSPLEVVDRLPTLVAQYGEPFTFGVHSFKLDALAADGVEVVYSGQGSGWYNFRRSALQLKYARLPAPARRLLRSLPSLLRRPAPELSGRIERIVREVPSLAERAYHERVTSRELRAALIHAPGATERRRVAIRLYEEALQEYRGESDLDRLLFVDERLTSSDHEVYWNYRWARVHDLVMRFPYRDLDLVDFVTHLHRPEPGKRHQRRFAETLMPRELAYAPKLHQHAPIIEWLRGGPLHEFAREALSESRLRESGLFDPRVGQRLLDQHAADEADHGWTIWTVLTTLLWQEHVLNAPLPQPLAAR